MTHGAVVVFARAPERGCVKTRLAPAVGEDGALALHRAFLADALAAARGSGARVLLAHTPSRPFPEQALADDAYPQRGEGFGLRLDGALADARERVQGPLVLVGADTPQTPPSALRDALTRLGDADAVLGPGREGGFHLIGFARVPVPIAEAFASGGEAANVARLLRARGARLALCEPSFDVDVPDDLRDLALHLDLLAGAGAPWTAPATTSALAALGVTRSVRERTWGERAAAPRGSPR